MAGENQESVQQSNEGFFAAAGALLESVRSTVNPVVELVSEPLLSDGMLGAAFRQGADELWQALKAFPSTIEVHEPGTLLNPTQGEIAESRRPEPEPAMTPGELAATRPAPAVELDSGKDLGQSL